jgi:hypothetical protein
MLATPSVAFADCGGGPSAQHVYSECVQGASGGKKTKTPTTHEQGPPISGQTANKLKGTGKDYRQLSAFARGRGQRGLESPPAGSASTPSALGSAFDLGSGPLALLAVLAGTALLLLGGSGLRLWRARHHV